MHHEPSKHGESPAASTDATAVKPRKPISLSTVLVVTVLVGCVAVVALRGSGPALGWSHDINAVSGDAVAQNKGVLLYFTADWCGPCRLMKSQVLNQPEVQQAIEAGFVPAIVDLTNPDDAANATARTHGVVAVPTFVALDARGQPIGRAGPMEAPEFIEWLRSLEDVDIAHVR